MEQMTKRSRRRRRRSSGRSAVRRTPGGYLKTPRHHTDLRRELAGARLLADAAPGLLPRFEPRGDSILVEEGVPLEESKIDTRKALIAVAELLDVLHAYGVVHGDAGRGNIVVLERTGRPTFIDYETAGEATAAQILAEERDFLFDMALMYPERRDELLEAMDDITVSTPVTRMFLGKPRIRISRRRRGDRPLADVLRATLDEDS